MSDLIQFALAVLVLLATPGPTNTLLAASGYAVGVRASLKLLPAELGGYLLAVIALTWSLNPLAMRHPAALTGFKLLAGGWLIYSAVRLWNGAGQPFAGEPCVGAPAPVSIRTVFVTTLLNPKALIFALLFAPRPLAPPWLAAFCGLIVGVGGCWIALGSALGRSTGHVISLSGVQRAAALVLAAFALLLIRSAAPAAL